jgi:uncharacterized protein YgbK (DUF1537 family)
MKIGVIADDFTGASDIALTLAEGGMRTGQFVGVPNSDVADVDAGVVSLKSRTIPVDDAVTQSLAACDWLLSQGATQIIFKVCSTFDSTEKGNIGQVAEALAHRLGETHVVTCPAFPENGRSVYQGHLFVNDGLLNESGMQDHPLTPMGDADLRRVLALQTTWDVTHVPMKIVGQGAAAIAEKIADLPASMVIVDAIADDDLRAIGAAMKERKLMTGGSGIAIGLPANFGITPTAVPWDGMTGQGVVLSGSCSRATRGQVAAFTKTNPIKELTAADVMDRAGRIDDLVDWVLVQDAAPLIYTSADPDVVRAAQDTYGTETIATAIEAMFAELAARLADAGVGRMVVAGGETSGAVVSGLKACNLRVGPRLAAGVPVLAVDDRPLAVALKSGNFGGPDFFAHALHLMQLSS